MPPRSLLRGEGERLALVTALMAARARYQERCSALLGSGDLCAAEAELQEVQRRHAQVLSRQNESGSVGAVHGYSSIHC